MKKTVNLCKLVITLLLFAMGTVTCDAGCMKSSALQKECKRMCKQLKKEGWKVFEGSSPDLKSALESYYAQLEAGGSEVLPLTATGTASNVNLAKTKAKARATNDYAGQLKSEVASIVNVKTTNTQAGGTVKTRQEMENALQVKTSGLVKGMSPVLTLRRDHDGVSEVQMLFILKHIGDDFFD